MTRTLLVVGFALGCLLADDGPPQKVQTTKTERMDFAPGGVLRLKNSSGVLIVDGWDRPEVEITTIKSTKAEYGDRAEGERVLEDAHTAVDHSTGEIVITTDFPSKGSHKLPRRGERSVDLTYEIKAPRNTKLIVDHEAGDVQVANLTNDIQVTVRNGEIAVYLPAEDKYDIDARTKFGGVTTGLQGHQQRLPWLIGQSFANQAAAAAHKVYLRARAGDILIFSR
jgi:hypothetical protein